MQKSVLFVCMGNICRSPTAHAVFRAMVQQAGLAKAIQVDSAGTLDYHAGHAPDRRAQAHALRRGYAMHDLRARQIMLDDFEQHDLVLVMDWDNLQTVQSRCPGHLAHKIQRLTQYCTRLHSEVVPDPYYGGTEGFEYVLDLVEDACRGLLATLSESPKVKE